MPQGESGAQETTGKATCPNFDLYLISTTYRALDSPMTGKSWFSALLGALQSYRALKIPCWAAPGPAKLLS